MIPLTTLRERPEWVVERLRTKHYDAQAQVTEILDSDKRKRECQKQLDDNYAEQNRIAKSIGQLFKEGRREEAEASKKRTAELKEIAKTLESTLNEWDEKINRTLVLLPNIPHDSVPEGKTAEDNVEEYRWGDFEKKHNILPHWDICNQKDLIDFETGCKLTGAGFPLYREKAAKLQRALINFFLDEATKAGYTEVQVPYVVNTDSAYATGQLPDKEGQMYFVGEDKLYLIPTAEVPITNIYRNCLLKVSDLPVRHCAYSACFRREAGSYGKDVRGLNRLHQFDKVEIVQIVEPEVSYQVLEEMKRHVGGLLQKLGLPYRMIRLCGGDISFTSALTFDFEVYAKGQEKWLEVSSVSNFENFQANRMKLRYKNQEGKPTLLHTLNGSALALPRVVAAILEDCQTENQEILVPEVLQSYTGFDRI
ncbi:MAG: serine--tRNA ligase [Bacteroidales bacterium]|jgi:seryl-tRNA synthetase|nr:serine--tRNA ligase [Bacteroidales bacterium]